MRLKGTRYAYTKTRVAYLVPFIFAVPAALVAGLIFLLNSHALTNADFLDSISMPVKTLSATLVLLGGYFAYDLWRTFLRVVSEEIWITDRDIVWIGRKRRVLRKAAHYEIEGLTALGGDRDHAWVYRIDTAHGPIKFWTSLEHADELIQRIESFLELKTAARGL